MTIIKVTTFLGEVHEFDSAQTDSINIGRSSQWANIVLENELKNIGVGREHCSLNIASGGVELSLNNRNQVWVDGYKAIDKQDLPQKCTLGLTEKDDVTKLTVETVLPSELGATIDFDGEVMNTQQRLIYRVKLMSLLIIPILFFVMWNSYQVNSVTDCEMCDLLTIEKIKNSIFSVQSKRHDNGYSHAGTAWLANDYKVITNRHVGKMVEQNIANNEAFIRLPSVSNSEGRLIKIVDIIYHPAESKFDEFLLTQKARPHNNNQLSLKPYDIAELIIEEPLDHLTPLKLESIDNFHKLKSDDRLTILGYPLNKGGNEWNIQRPDTEMSKGFFDKKRGYAHLNGELVGSPFISYSNSTAGGYSGSPVFNNDAKVVGIHFSGSKALVKASNTDSSPVRVNTGGKSYAQSLRLLHQFIDGSIFEKSVMEKEELIWAKWIQKLPSIESSKVIALDKSNESTKYTCIAEIVDNWQTLAHHPYAMNKRHVIKTFQLPVKGKYSVFIQSYANAQCLPLKKGDGCISVSYDTSVKGGSLFLNQSHFEFDFNTLTEKESSEITIELTGPDDNSLYSIKLYLWSDEQCESEIFKFR